MDSEGRFKVIDREYNEEEYMHLGKALFIV